MPDARECAQLFVETVPRLMRSFGEAMRQCKRDDDEHMTMGQMRMLGILQAEPRTLGVLASLHHVTPSTMSRTVDVLVRKNWVERRQVILSLTPDGQAAHAALGQEVQAAMTQVIEGMIAELDDAERTQLYDGLSILRKLLNRPTAGDC